ncbi:hypothetical protein EPN16_03260 [bacterium]|nr:MAG: hypothetical protein EPN16_03260 [bacterium]
MRKCKTVKGQSILEYVILLAVVLLAVLYGANNIIKAKAKNNMDTAGAILDKADAELRTSTGTTTASSTSTGG